MMYAFPCFEQKLSSLNHSARVHKWTHLNVHMCKVKPLTVFTVITLFFLIRTLSLKYIAYCWTCILYRLGFKLRLKQKHIILPWPAYVYSFYIPIHVGRLDIYLNGIPEYKHNYGFDVIGNIIMFMDKQVNYRNVNVWWGIQFSHVLTYEYST